jgi:Terpene cyclase DEP1
MRSRQLLVWSIATAMPNIRAILNHAIVINLVQHGGNKAIVITWEKALFIYLLTFCLEVLAIAGSIAPWFWLLQDTTVLLSPTLFLQRAFENNVAADITSDLLISALVFFGFVWVELRRLEISRLWVIAYIGLMLGVGLSCALPCFLYHGEQIPEGNTLR